MLFNGINFNFGKIEVVISSVDTEKATGYLEIKIPLTKAEISINVKRWQGWNGETKVNLHFDISDIKDPEPEMDEEEDYGEEESNEEESA